jgi:hypothetical protein
MRRGPGAQTGQETLQAILVVAFVLLPLLVAVITFGSIIHDDIAAQAAAAAGARSAGADGGFGAAEYARVADELTSNHIDPAQCDVTASSAVVDLGQPISVTVSCPEHVGIPFLLQQDIRLHSTFVARGEVNR